MKKFENMHALLDKVREKKPVVHHLTNWVTINDCAQIVKTIGASPVMAHAMEEAAEMTKIASAVVLNIGTLTTDLVEAMKSAACAANERGIPVILDVCGAGATALRDQKCLELLAAAKINIIKGNGSEIARIAGKQVKTRGVDAGTVEDDLAAIARALANERAATVVVTGPVDIITDGTRTCLVHNGHPMMAQVVGTGCMAASVIGAFAGVESDLVVAAAAALVCYEIAAELAAAKSSGPASFKNNLFDCLYGLEQKTVQERVRIEVSH